MHKRKYISFIYRVLIISELRRRAGANFFTYCINIQSFMGVHTLKR